MLILLISGGTGSPVLSWAFVVAALIFSGSGLVFGLMTGAGPMLSGTARSAHPWMHRAMYVASAATALVVAADRLEQAPPWPEPSLALMLLLSIASLHAIFHLWRHTALGDGALRLMTPRALHGIL
ncbi:hypothetical protein [Aestuariicoccus sp. MJ-SS9]|uniref:hypothetical protein n=1 Tax=Aestuariicoccus sp. MJ-SS9 TaxID=3079855 RepID=UPI00290A7982|nr:hypothetical protein [Aestuariicoccus sp. MJ-SS9]MDU8909845.1 hypothetical protein [Aestuariicoccus sp. MJ-SS9]